MISILRAVSTVNSRALKPSSNAAKHVREKLEYLNKEHAKKSDEEAPQEKIKDKRKGKMKVEPQKK